MSYPSLFLVSFLSDWVSFSFIFFFTKLQIISGYSLIVFHLFCPLFLLTHFLYVSWCWHLSFVSFLKTTHLSIGLPGCLPIIYLNCFFGIALYFYPFLCVSLSASLSVSISFSFWISANISWRFHLFFSLFLPMPLLCISTCVFVCLFVC